MNKNQVFELQQSTKSNPIAQSIFTVLALRKRGRNTISVQALTEKMKHEGFNYTKKQCGDVLRTLDKLGLGHVEEDRKGRVKRLKDIKATLRSIGEVAVGQSNRLMPSLFRPNPYKKPQQRRISMNPKTMREVEQPPMSLSLIVGKYNIKLEMPGEMSTPEIINIITKLKGGSL